MEKIHFESGRPTITVNGEKIIITLKGSVNAEDERGLYPNTYYAIGYHPEREKPFEAEHSNKEKAVNAIKIQMEKFLEEQQKEV